MPCPSSVTVITPLPLVMSIRAAPARREFCSSSFSTSRVVALKNPGTLLIASWCTVARMDRGIAVVFISLSLFLLRFRGLAGLPGFLFRPAASAGPCRIRSSDVCLCPWPA